MLIAMEGADGVGKTTQSKLLVKSLKKRSETSLVKLVKEPGGTPIGEKLRDLIFDDSYAIQDETEALLFLADHIEMSTVIHDWLDKDYVVVSDRFIDSSFVYQGICKGKFYLMRSLHEVTNSLFAPNLTIVINLPVNKALARLKERAEINRNDLKPRKYHADIRKGYKLAQYFSKLGRRKRGWINIDGDGTVEEVHQRIYENVVEYIRHVDQEGCL